MTRDDSAQTFDPAAIRRHFPALEEGAAHFDGPGGTQVPQVVAEAVAGTLSSAISNRGIMTESARRADTVVRAARDAVADLIGSDPQGVIFGRSMTQLTYDMARTLAKNWAPGDEVVVTRLDHDANIRPWVHAAEKSGALVRWAEFDADTGELDLEAVTQVLTTRTKLVAVTAASNLLGTRTPVAEIADAAHAIGALVYVDGVHLTPHVPIDVGVMRADFYACSPYKFLGPHCGTLSARVELLELLHPDKLLPASDAVPERYELGTLPYELMAGTTAAIDFIAGIAHEPGTSRRQRLVDAMRGIERYEEELRVTLEARLGDIDGLVLHGRARRRTPTILFSIRGMSAHDIQGHLARERVNVSAGSFYAVEASRHIGLGDLGAVRAGIAPYTDLGDIDRLVAAVTHAAERRTSQPGHSRARRS